MASRIEITCVSKSDNYRAHERILSIGGRTVDGKPWKMSHEGAIRGIEDGKYYFFMTRGSSVLQVVVAISLHGHKYLKTIADDEQPFNLLNLPECPAPT
jgi:hypothetical protein